MFFIHVSCSQVKLSLLGIDIWEQAVLPKLLFNSGCWQDISDNTVHELEDLQLKFYRCLFAVGSGCPIPSLYWETGGTMIKYRILRNKLLLLHHIATLTENSLARQVYEVQKHLNLPGLLQECKNFLVNAKVTEIGKYTQIEWKRLVKAKIHEMNRDDILNQMRKPYKKISYEEHVDQKLQLQPYLISLHISDARLCFKLKTGMTPTVRMKFPSDPEFSRKLWTCPGCTEDKPGHDQVVGYRDAHTVM